MKISLQIDVMASETIRDALLREIQFTSAEMVEHIFESTDNPLRTLAEALSDFSRKIKRPLGRVRFDFSAVGDAIITVESVP